MSNLPGGAAMQAGLFSSTIKVDNDSTPYEFTVVWNIHNAKDMVLRSPESFKALFDKLSMTFFVEAHNNFYSSEWKLSFSFDGEPDLEDEDNCAHVGEFFLRNEGVVLDWWLVFLTCRMVNNSTNESDFASLNFDMETDVLVNNSIVHHDNELCDTQTGGILKRRRALCKISTRENVLLTDSEGKLVVRVKLRFHRCKDKTNECMQILKLKDQDIKDESYEEGKLMARNTSVEVTLITNDGFKLIADKNRLTAGSPTFLSMLEQNDDEEDVHVCDTVILNFHSEIVRLILDYLATGQIQSCTAKFTHDQDLHVLSELIRFAHLYNMDKLKEYFSLALPIVASENLHLAASLYDLAVHYSMTAAQEEIEPLMSRNNTIFLVNMGAGSESPQQH